MWEAVRPAWAAMSRKMGTGAASLGADFFSMCAGGIFAGGPIGPCVALWGESKPVQAIHRMAVCPVRMQSDCSAAQDLHDGIITWDIETNIRWTRFPT